MKIKIKYLYQDIQQDPNLVDRIKNVVSKETKRMVLDIDTIERGGLSAIFDANKFKIIDRLMFTGKKDYAGNDIFEDDNLHDNYGKNYKVYFDDLSGKWMISTDGFTTRIEEFTTPLIKERALILK